MHMPRKIVTALKIFYFLIFPTATTLISIELHVITELSCSFFIKVTPHYWRIVMDLLSISSVASCQQMHMPRKIVTALKIFYFLIFPTATTLISIELHVITELSCSFFIKVTPHYWRIVMDLLSISSVASCQQMHMPRKIVTA